MIRRPRSLSTLSSRTLQQTGVTATFDRVLSIRQMHTALFGKSDLFFTLGLRAVAGKEDVCIQESEIEAATWMNIDEFLANPFYQGRPLYLQILESCRGWAEGRWDGMRGDLMQGGFRPRLELLLYGTGSDSAPAPATGPAGEEAAMLSERRSDGVNVRSSM